MASKGLAFGLTLTKKLLNRSNKNDNATMYGRNDATMRMANNTTMRMANNTTMRESSNVPKEKWPLRRKLRIFFAVPILMTAISMLLAFLLLVAGSKPGFMPNYAVFTLNTSRIGEGIHQKIDGAIADWNPEDLDLSIMKRSLPTERSLPVELPTMVVTATTTLITTPPVMPRSVKSVLESLTDKAGDGVASANSAVHSKASDVKSQASSAANSVQSSVNSGIDKAAREVKDKVTDLVDDGFAKLRNELDLPGFTAVFMRNTCNGSYTEDEHNKTQAKIDTCNVHTGLNPMRWVQLFYWTAFMFVGLGHATEVLVVLQPEKRRWFNWTMLFLSSGAGFLAVGSGLSQGVSDVAVRLTYTFAGFLSVGAAAGYPFLSTSWATMILLVVNVGTVYFFRWYADRHALTIEDEAEEAKANRQTRKTGHGKSARRRGGGRGGDSNMMTMPQGGYRDEGAQFGGNGYGGYAQHDREEQDRYQNYSPGEYGRPV